MKVTIAKEKTLVEFEDLDAGDAFEMDGFYYIKVVCRDKCNAIRLSEFKLVNFYDDTKVVKVESELIIKG